MKLQPGDKALVSIDLFNPEQRRVALRLEQEEKENKEEKKKGAKKKEAGEKG